MLIETLEKVFLDFQCYYNRIDVFEITYCWRSDLLMEKMTKMYGQGFASLTTNDLSMTKVIEYMLNSISYYVEEIILMRVDDQCLDADDLMIR